MKWRGNKKGRYQRRSRLRRKGRKRPHKKKRSRIKVESVANVMVHSTRTGGLLIYVRYLLRLVAKWWYRKNGAARAKEAKRCGETKGGGVGVVAGRRLLSERRRTSG